jgi:hypothetical protein
MLTKETVRDALETIGNTFFTVSFVAKDGGTRVYNGRIKLDRVVSIKGAGQEWRV